MATGDASKPRVPSGLKRSGRALYKAITEVYELDDHERALLLEAARTADALDALQTVLDNEGVMAESSQGPRAHPALVERRQQALALARLLAALHIPTEETPAVRAARGVYRIGGV